MKINSKFVYVKKRSVFENLISSIPQGLDPIVFIEDTREIWNCGTYFSMNTPDVFISEKDGAIDFNIGTTVVNISTTGGGLSIKKGVKGESIILSSTALTGIKANKPLSWDSTKKELNHDDSGVTEGTYGPISDTNNASIFEVPFYTVDEKGHLKNGGTKRVEIRDYVEQLASGTDNVERPLLSSFSNNNEDEKNKVRKASGVTYNESNQKLTVHGGVESRGDSKVTGNFRVEGGKIYGNVEGDVSGSAIPKIHLSQDPEYGGSSTEMYGHVKLQDDLVGVPARSSDNTDKNNAGVEARAASPYMVYSEIEKVKKTINDKPSIKEFTNGINSLTINEIEQIINLNGSRGVKIEVDQETSSITIKGLNITAYANDNKVSVLDQLNFSGDFELDKDNNLNIKWIEV